MMQLASGLLVLILAADVYSAPQFITFKDGKLGVNFGGYHAGVGIGTGGNGGLYAEAGTPHGQSAMAGLGGAFGTKGGYTGGLFAGAQAAENVHASAGLGGLAVGNGYATGNGFATAQAGSHVAASSMGGHSSSAVSTGYKVQSFGIPATVVKETEVAVAPIEVISEKKKVHKEIKFEAENEVNPLPLNSAAEAHIDAKVDLKTESQPATVLVKEVYVEPQPQIIEKTKIHTHYKPQHHHVHKTAYIGGYLGGGADFAPPAAYTPIQKRVDLGVEGSENVETVDFGAHGQGGAQTTITKEVAVGKSPSFFGDIFNIPISTLQAVGNLLSNTAANTKVSVQKSATIQADSDTISSKHAPLSSSSLSDTQISVETPSVSQIIDGIFSIPINTLGAVNKFLENNVYGRKRTQVQESTGESTRARLGPHARRRANKVIYVQQETSPKPEEIR